MQKFVLLMLHLSFESHCFGQKAVNFGALETRSNSANPSQTNLNDNEIPREDIVPYHPFYHELYQGKQANDIDFFPENKTTSNDSALSGYKNVICSDKPDQKNFCVRWCEEIQELKAETYWNKHLLPATRKLIDNILRIRLCSAKGQEEKYRCSEPEPEYPFAGGSFLFFTGGWSNRRQVENTEFHDLSDSLRSCKSFKDLPIKAQSGVIGVIDGKKILVCGGNIEGYDEKAISDCYSLDTSVTTSAWKNEESMQEKRSYAAARTVPKTGGFFVTGGITTNSIENEELISKTSEIFLNGKWTPGPELPTPISRHCLVQLDDTRCVIIGGKSSVTGDASTKTWILDWNSDTPSWSQGPDLQNPRMDHACGVISLDNKQTAIVVTGGLSNTGSYSASEVLKIDNEQTVSGLKWTPGPNLPIQLTGGETAQVPLANGGQGFLLIGGYRQNTISGEGLGFSADIYLMRKVPEKELAWEDLRTKMKVPRYETMPVVLHKDNFRCN